LSFFPGLPRSAQEVLYQLDAAGENVYYGLMVDRIAWDGNIDAPVESDSSLFTQYPFNCAVTLLVQGSDVRKATAYRGYLRTTSGNHDVLGLHETSHLAVQRRPREMQRLMALLREAFGERNHAAMPKVLGAVLPTAYFASLYHFKWVRGLAAKLERRAKTEVYTNGQYGDLRAIMEKGNILNDRALAKFCNRKDLPDASDLFVGSQHENS
jgi:hypothetical protein